MPVAVAVEGQDYFHLLLSQIDGPPEFQDVELWDFKSGSIRDWLENFKTLRNFETIRAIGIIRDGENNTAGMFASIKNALEANGFTAPDANGEIYQGTPKVGILIMPHDKPAGCLENSILEALAPNLKLECAEKFLECVNDPDRNDNWRAKVLVHSLITACEKPSITLGQSAREGLWDFSKPSLKIMFNFIADLAKV